MMVVLQDPLQCVADVVACIPTVLEKGRSRLIALIIIMFRRQFHLTARVLAEYPKGKSGNYLKPYIAFVQSIRKSVMDERPHLTVPEFGKVAGEKWRALSESERQNWKRLYEEAVGKK